MPTNNHKPTTYSLLLLLLFTVTYAMVNTGSTNGLQTTCVPIIIPQNLLQEPVSIYKESNDFVHIFGKKDADVAFAEGWVAAELRLWQWDFYRHVANGSLSTILGSAGNQYDILANTIDVRGKADQTFQNHLPITKLRNEQFARGLNHFLNVTNLATLTMEYSQVFRSKPAPFVAQDITRVETFFQYGSSMNAQFEIQRLVALYSGMTLEQVLEIYPQGSSFANFPSIIQKADVPGMSGLCKADIERIELAF
jgi:penicillin amidase